MQLRLPCERVTGQSNVHFFVPNPRGTGVAVRVAAAPSKLKTLEERKGVFLKNFKVNADKEHLHGDLEDMSDFAVWSGAGMGAWYPVAVSQTITSTPPPKTPARLAVTPMGIATALRQHFPEEDQGDTTPPLPANTKAFL